MSLLEQLEAKAQVTGDVGEKLDKDLSQAEADAFRLAGGAIWLRKGAALVSGLMVQIRESRDKGELDKLDEKDVFDLLSKWNLRASECLQNLAEQKKSEALSGEGRVAALKESLELVKRHHMAAVLRIKQIQAAIEEETPTVSEEKAKEERKSRAPGEHPGPSPLDERRAAAKKTKKKTTRKCSKCRKPGHTAKSCPEK